jgi:RNA polymerase primary sigma factor
MEDILEYQKEINEFKLLTNEEEKELSVKIQEGDFVALKTLVDSNKRYVFALAKVHKNKKLNLNDLIEIGNKELIRVARTFNSSLNVSFSSLLIFVIINKFKSIT